MANNATKMGMEQEEFEAAFPYHLLLDNQLQIISIGHVLARTDETSVAGKNLHDCFEIIRPDGIKTYEDFCANSRTLFIVRQRKTDLTLRGQFLARANSNQILFLGSPWVTSSDDLARYNLTLSDFALHDPIIDLLSLAQAKNAAQQDIVRLVDRLKEKTQLLQETNAVLQTNNSDLTKARDEAQAATQAKSEFLARMSHEIRTPMHGMLSMIDIMGQKVLDAESKNYLDVMKESSVSLLSIINDILDLSKIEAGKIEIDIAPFDIDHLLLEVKQLYWAGAQKKGLELRIASPPEAKTFTGDAGRIRQILTNLVSNGLKFTERGYIEIRATYLTDGDPRLHFAVTDTGPGIPEDKQHLLFQNFSQIDGADNRKHGGTGLGLSISKTLTQLMGGRISVESQLGKGATFHVEIPTKCLDHHPQLAQEMAANEVCPLPSKRILVVDDHPINRRIIEFILKKQKVDFVLAESGEQAIDILKEQPIALVFMDIQMPGMDGIETTQKIRAGNSPPEKLPIVAMTANALKGDRERFLAAGMQDYISKPFKEDDLMNLIRKWSAT
ncbi:MAG: response regulator [Bdellovibrionales bacterium]|nr:response regulator [Bdellovibrionales bacterium]